MIIEEGTRIKVVSTHEVEEALFTKVTKKEDNPKTEKLKMDQVREENERLKLTLSQMMKDYHSLKMKFNEIIQEDYQSKKSNDSAAISDQESEFVSLRLGRSSGDHSMKGEKTLKSSYNERKNPENDGLELGLECKFHLSNNSTQVSKNPRPENSSGESKEEGNGDIIASHKSPKASRSGSDDDILQHNPLKKPRVSVRAVCNTQTMNDGCQWRKYGQKTAKGNPCPRAYYRCTVSSTCPVRKQVQRCMDDMTILITTYEGTHNHPLTLAATTMASATSAAAAMLSCGSTTSPPRHSLSAISPNLLGCNFDSHFPRATISSSQSHPTVILDLTAPNHLTSTPQNNRFSLSATHSSPTSLNFSSSNSSFDPREGNFPSIKKLANSSYSQPFDVYNNIQASQREMANDPKIAAITRNPTFQSALAAAITSFVETDVQGRNSGLNFHLSFSQPSTSNGSTIEWARSFLDKFPQSSVSPQQTKNLTHFPPLTLSTTSKSQAVALADDQAEQIINL